MIFKQLKDIRDISIGDTIKYIGINHNEVVPDGSIFKIKDIVYTGLNYNREFSIGVSPEYIFKNKNWHPQGSWTIHQKVAHDYLIHKKLNPKHFNKINYDFQTA